MSMNQNENPEKIWIDERHYKILHNKYDDHGNVVGQYYVEYQENETADTIYITDAALEQEAKKLRKGSTTSSNYSGYEKKVVYDTNKEPVSSVTMKNSDGKMTEVVMEFTNGLKKIFLIPVEGA